MNDSTIILYSSVPLDSSYTNTLYTSTVASQLDYFSRYSHWTWENQSYIRPQGGKIQVRGQMSANQNAANYVIFINPSHENKYFFGFVSEVNYINDLTFEIVFELDYIQTYLTTLKTNRCWIERAHIPKSDDIIDSNLEPEPFNPPLYVARNEEINTTCVLKLWFYEYPSSMPNMHINPTVSTFNGNSILWCVGTESGDTNVTTLLNRFVTDGEFDKIACLGVAPTGGGYTEEFVNINRMTTPHGYEPRNNKVLSSAFQKISVVSPDGASFTFTHKELGNGSGSPTARLRVTRFAEGMTPEIQVALVNYNNTGSDSAGNKIMRCDFSSFPVFPFKSDIWAEFWSKKGTTWAVNTAASAGAGAISGLASGAGAVGAAAGAIAGAALNIFSTLYQVSREAPTVNGSTSPVIDYLENGLSFNILQYAPTLEQLRLLDYFFDRYGYAVNKCTSPQLNARPYYTYIKTRNSNVTGQMPGKARDVINRAFNNGVTFWTTAGNICDWSVDNNG